MEGHLEVWREGRAELVPLEGGRLTIGHLGSNDVALPADDLASGLHAVLDRFPAGWCVADLGSTNGTYLNGMRIWGERRLRSGDEIRVGQTRIVFRAETSAAQEYRTGSGQGVPDLTRREREVLVALCRTGLGEATFRGPATIRQIAATLVISEAAVKQHLSHLYDKFAIHEGEEPRRVRLANEAIRRGAVTMGDIEPPDPS